MVDICYNWVVTTISWKDYITSKYLEWRSNKVGRRGSAASFAREIGISPQLLNDWMNKGQAVSDSKHIHKLVKMFGFEVYDVLGMPRPDFNDPVQALVATGFPSELAGDLSALLAKVLKTSQARMAEKGIDKDSPEAIEIIKDELSKSFPRPTDTE